MKKIIHTEHAPAAVGPYSQAVACDHLVFLSGQIGLDPQNNQLRQGINAQAEQVLRNLKALCQAAGGDLNDIVKLNVFLCDINDFSLFNDLMKQYFSEPYPARAVVAVSALPKGALLEAEAILHLND